MRGFQESFSIPLLFLTSGLSTTQYPHPQWTTSLTPLSAPDVQLKVLILVLRTIYIACNTAEGKGAVPFWSHSSSHLCHFPPSSSILWSAEPLCSPRQDLYDSVEIICIHRSLFAEYTSPAVRSTILSGSPSSSFSHLKPVFSLGVERTGSASERLMLREALYKWSNTNDTLR